MAIERIQWTCPICKRRYAIPATAPTPSRCPQCRQQEEQSSDAGGLASLAAAALDDDDDSANADEESRSASSALSALAAIQLEVEEEAARGPAISAPVVRHVEATATTLRTLSLVYTVLSGLAVVIAFGWLLYGLHAAFALPATHERAILIFQAIAVFGAGLIAALTFFTFREVIRILLDIEENIRAR